MIYCTININLQDLRKLPGKSGYDFVDRKNMKIDGMVQKAIFYAVDKIKQKEPKIAFLKEGPYAVPVIK